MRRDPRADWRCRLLGCDWETRKAYDLCRRCQAARWHVARVTTADTAPVLVPEADRRRMSTWRAWSLPSLVLLDCEGSELFVDDDELAPAG